MPWVFTDETKFYLHEGETLLDGMIRTGHKQVRFECRQGYCGSCRMQLHASIGHIGLKHAPVALLAKNEVLACCCLPKGTIKVSYHTDAKHTALIPLIDEQDGEVS